ncbi:MAG: hypothetical protein VYC34_10400 [Planctomycetota bacterium]|nr:hypothetical protein [Planctomycetota bacterium]
MLRLKIILPLALIGALLGVGAVLGWTRRYEIWLWGGYAALTALVVVWRAPGLFFAHAFIAGFLGALARGLIQAWFFGAFLANNPGLASQPAYQPSAGGVSARAIAFAMAPVIALVGGALLGGVTWIAATVLRRPRVDAETDSQ